MRSIGTSVLQHLICLCSCTTPAGLVLGLIGLVLMAMGVPQSFFTEFGGGVLMIVLALGLCAVFYYLILKFIRESN